MSVGSREHALGIVGGDAVSCVWVGVAWALMVLEGGARGLCLEGPLLFHLLPLVLLPLGLLPVEGLGPAGWSCCVVL